MDPKTRQLLYDTWYGALFTWWAAALVNLAFAACFVNCKLGDSIIEINPMLILSKSSLSFPSCLSTKTNRSHPSDPSHRSERKIKASERHPLNEIRDAVCSLTTICRRPPNESPPLTDRLQLSENITCRCDVFVLYYWRSAVWLKGPKGGTRHSSGTDPGRQSTSCAMTALLHPRT